MAKKYWAIMNFPDYDIVYQTEQPYQSEEGISYGFKTLEEAKTRIRKWIAGDRSELEGQLDKCMSYKRSDLRKDK